MDDSNPPGMRTRARAAQSVVSSTAAANIRQLAKSTRSTVGLSKQEPSPKSSVKEALSEDQQKISVKALFDCRVTLQNAERTIRAQLESGLFQLRVSSEGLHDKYAMVKSLRQYTEQICESMEKGSITRDQIDILRSIIQFSPSLA